MAQDACCAAVRRFLSKRIGERLSIEARPDREVRNAPAVEEVWRSTSHGYAVEHTRIEAFEEQIQDGADFQRLVDPLQQLFAGVVPGRFTAWIPFGVASRSGVGLDAARQEIARLIAARVNTLRDGETVVLRSDRLPYDVRLRKRHSKESRVFFGRWIDGLADDARAQRIGRALDQKIPKLRAAAEAYALKSVLILESDDIALSNAIDIGQAFKRALEGRREVPDLVILVETEGVFYGWLLKDGDQVLPDSNYFEDYGTVNDED
jgi:hypothetical protein